MSASSPHRARSGQVRIVGGRWRGRRLPVPRTADVRPSSDRIRETLFNWLQPCIAGSRCLDLFAGSGVLGLEAASRGAREVVLVDNSAVVTANLSEQIRRLGAQQVRVQHADARRFLAHNRERFDVIFLDPPFDSVLLGQSLEAVAKAHCLANDGMIYVETRRTGPLPGAPWEEYRRQRAGHVAYGLFTLRQE